MKLSSTTSEGRLQSKVKSTCTFCVRLIDSVTGSWPNDASLRVFIEGLSVRPVVKFDGYIAFMDLPPGTYRVVVQSARYFDAGISIATNDLNAEYPVICLNLLPRPNYPFSAGLALIRGVLEDSLHRPLAGVVLRGDMQSESSYLARLAQPVSAESAFLSLTDVKSTIFDGDRLVLVDWQKEVMEDCRILFNAVENSRGFHLEGPLQHPFERGTCLYPVLSTKTDERGQWVMFVRAVDPTGAVIRISSPSTTLEDITIHPGQSAQIHLTAT